METTKPRIVKRSLKIAVIVAVIIVALLGMTIIAAGPVLDSSQVKSQIENIVGETLDMSFKIEGRIKLGFWPFLSVVANKLKISTSQGEIASADRIEIDPRLLDLIFLKVHLDDVHIHNPQLTFDPHALDKIFALAAKRSDDPLPVESLVIESFSISNAKFYYSDDQTVVDIDIGEFTVAATEVVYSEGKTAVDIPRLNLTGDRLTIIEKNKLTIKDFDALCRKARFDANIQIDNLSVGSEKFDNIRSVIHGDRGSLKSELIEMDYFGARTKIAGIFNLKDSLNHLKVRIEMPQVDLKKSFEDSEKVDIIEGMINIQAEFEARAAFFNEILKKMNGNFSIKGRNLKLKGVDLDKALDEFKKMRGYGFNDLSALILLGPLGTVVSQGYDQLEALEKIMKATGNSTIEQVVSDWNVAAGVVTTKEVAFSTQRNRVAVKGSLDLANKKFNNVTFAVVDSNGCIVNSETVDGTFEEPEIKDVGIIERTVVRPLKRFLKTDCNIFYNGAVPHPSGQQ